MSKGFKVKLLLCPFLLLKDTGMQTEIENAVKKALEAAGQVTHLKDNDMRGFGAGNILLIQIGNVTAWDGVETSVSRISLSVETSVTLDKTGIKTFPMVWSINTFLQGPIDSRSEGNLTKAVQKLVGDFVQNYQYANQGQAKRPVFYTYEGVAKLHGSEKSMILEPVERQGIALLDRADGGLLRGAGEEARSQQAPKGRFCASKSFATPSYD